MEVSLLHWQLHWMEAWLGLTLVLAARYLLSSLLFFRHYWQGHSHLSPIQRQPGALKLGQAIQWSLASQPVIAAVAVYVWIASENNWNFVYYQISKFSAGYFVFSALFLVIGHEIFHYGMHRYQHRNPWFLRHVHGVHHRFRTPTPFTEVAFHPLDALLHTMYIPLVLHVLPINLYLLLGYVAYLGAVNTYGHLGFELFPKVPKFLANVTSHDHHHTRPTKNFGLHSTIPDRILGTYWETPASTQDRDAQSKEMVA